MQRENNYKKLKDYFCKLCKASTKIKDFAAYSDRELREKTNSLKGMQSPFLHLWKYNLEYAGENASTMAVINLGYVILKNNVATDDFEDQYDAVDECEAIAHHVNARLLYDSNKPDHFLFNAFLKHRTQINPVYMEELGFGVEVQVYFKNPQSLQLDPEEWNDIDNACP